MRCECIFAGKNCLRLHNCLSWTCTNLGFFAFVMSTSAKLYCTLFIIIVLFKELSCFYKNKCFKPLKLIKCFVPLKQVKR